MIGEVGLAGEVRPVSQIERRVKEAERLGFKRCIIPIGNQKGLRTESIKTIGARSLREAIEKSILHS
ncbi:DNA repair protein RadA [subsurface metagenome]